ncbi:MULTISPECIES: ribosome silencing factor [unclassified Yoonia]|uniref:ribosome silencing factor n=1 Tax=unclassified Yoonia TaxID=2629118 RepID=UPI002AFF051B|nr:MULTISPECIES: ribosome silencing factor [unclassified Yoonia]
MTPRTEALSVPFQEDNALSLSISAATPANTGAHAMQALKIANSESILASVLQSLDDDKGEDIVQINLRGKSEMGDYMVIVSGRSTRQVSAMAEKLQDRLKQEFGLISKTEGKETGDWVLVDTGDVIVHIFRPEVREFYQLEKMWQPGKVSAG